MSYAALFPIRLSHHCVSDLLGIPINEGAAPKKEREPSMTYVRSACWHGLCKSMALIREPALAGRAPRR
jgi:hypothetical protein